MFELAGRVAFITGSGQGVGAAISRTLAAQGASIAVNDISAERAESRVSEIVCSGGRAVAAVADVTDRASIERFIQQTQDQLGPIDILINNAGVPVDGLPVRDFIETEPSEWQSIIDLNLWGVLYCSYAVLGSMIDRQWGRIVTVTSDAGRVGESGIAVYSAAKAAAAGFSRALSKEIGPYGVTANCISLGSIQPENVPPDNATKQRAARYPMRRLGCADDVAPAVLWLVSEEAGWTTGQTFSVSGGYVTC